MTGDRKLEFSKQDTAIAKGTAIILMMVHHLFAFPDRLAEDTVYLSMFQWQGSNIESYLGDFGKICVGIFTVLSGYGLYLSLNGKENIQHEIEKRIWNLYKTAWKIMVFAVPIGYLLRVKRLLRLSKGDVILNFFGYKSNYNGEWWFLLPFMILMVMFPVFLKWINRKNHYWLKDILMLALMTAMINKILPNLMEQALFVDFARTQTWKICMNCLKLMPMFLMGMICARDNLFYKYRAFFKGTAIRLTAMLVMLVIVFLVRKNYSWTADYLFAPLFLVSATTLIGSIPYIKKLFAVIGRWSTWIWLIHSFLCYYFCQKLVFAPRYSLLIVFWLILLSILSAIVIEYIWRWIFIAWGKLVNLNN